MDKPVSPSSGRGKRRQERTAGRGLLPASLTSGSMTAKATDIPGHLVFSSLWAMCDLDTYVQTDHTHIHTHSELSARFKQKPVDRKTG